MRPRTVRLVGLVMTSSVGCGPSPPPATTHAQGARDAGVSDAHAEDAAVPDPFGQLAPKRDLLAPGGHEVARKLVDPASEPTLRLAKLDGDACLRVAFSAGAPVGITLVNAQGIELATADATHGVLGANGPVCFRKDDTPTFRFTGQARLALVVWSW